MKSPPRQALSMAALSRLGRFIQALLELYEIGVGRLLLIIGQWTFGDSIFLYQYSLLNHIRSVPYEIG